MGVPISLVDPIQAVTWIGSWASSQETRMVCTVNPEFVMRARYDADFRNALQKSDMSVPDGIGVVIAAKLLGLPITTRVAGVDLVQAVCGEAAHQGWRIFLLGGAAGVAESAAANLKQSWPDLQIAGCSSASREQRFDDKTVAEINATNPNILLVAFGAPFQELWIQRNRPHLRCGVALGVGGSLDYLSGRSTRAPKLLSALGLEWAFRLVVEPRRWRRMLVLPAFSSLAIWQALRRALKIATRVD